MANARCASPSSVRADGFVTTAPRHDGTTTYILGFSRGVAASRRRAVPKAIP
jgi:hypothetical protein